MGTVEILTPYDQGEITELSSGIFRKQVLPCRSIQYTGKDGQRRTIDFNQQYLTDLARNFRAGAFDEVALQMADGANTHTLDPERKRASVIGLEVEPDGMYALVKPNNKRAAQFLRENPKMGVSARIIEGMSRSDGKQFSRALHHVLVTTDPQIPGLKAWEEVEAVSLSAGGPDETVNLAGASYEGTIVMAGTNGPGTGEGGSSGNVTVSLTADQAALLQQMLTDTAASNALADAVQLTSTYEQQDEAASDDALELVRQEVELAQAQNLELAQRLNDAEIAGELRTLAQSGLAPAILEAARPLLSMQTGAVELSNASGQVVDPGAVVRNLLDTVIQLSRAGLDVINLDAETGSAQGVELTAADSERESVLAAWADQYGN